MTDYSLIIKRYCLIVKYEKLGISLLLNQTPIPAFPQSENQDWGKVPFKLVCHCLFGSGSTKKLMIIACYL